MARTRGEYATEQLSFIASQSLVYFTEFIHRILFELNALGDQFRCAGFCGIVFSVLVLA